MVAALLTALLFSCSAIFGQRAAKLYGPLRANALRLTLACAVLAIMTLIWDAVRGHSSFEAAVFPALFLSGAVGFGLGDVGLFLAYSRLGARLTILINFSLGTLFAALGDWAWLGEKLSGRQGMGVGLVLAGLGLALWPAKALAGKRTIPWAGLGFAVMAGAGQGFGTTLSGWANRVAAEHGVVIHGISQALQRCTAGVLVAVLAWATWHYLSRGADSARVPAPTRKRHAGFWLAGAALFGPVLGVSCYQWARMELPSAVVVAIAATSTLWVIPLARFIDGDHPSLRQTSGTLLAVCGIAVLYLARS